MANRLVNLVISLPLGLEKYNQLEYLLGENNAMEALLRNFQLIIIENSIIMEALLWNCKAT